MAAAHCIKGLDIAKRGLDQDMLKAINNLDKRDHAITIFGEANQTQLAEVGSGHMQSPDVYDARALIVSQKEANKVLKDMINSTAEALVDSKIQVLKAHSPPQETVMNPQTLTTQSMADEVLKNEHHALVIDDVVALVKLDETLAKAHAFPGLRTKAAKAVYDGKRCIGAHYGLKKLGKIKLEETPEGRHKLAQSTLANVITQMNSSEFKCV